MLELEGISDSPAQPLTGHQFSQLSHVRVSTELYCFSFHGLKALDSRQLNYTKMATGGEAGWRTPRQSLQGADWIRAVTQLGAKQNPLETTGFRDEAVKRYHASPEGQEAAQLLGGSPSRVRLPAFSLLTTASGPTARVAEGARQA